MQHKEIKRAALSLVALVGLHVVYTLLVVPVVEPPAPKRMQNGVRVGAPMPSATERYQADIAGLFPEDAWENRSPKILRNRNTLLLFEDYKAQDDGTLHVFPCTAVILGDRSSDKTRLATSLIVQAPEGAVLQMNRPNGIRVGQLGKPVSGFLQGKIHIHSAGNADGSDRLDILTSDVQIRRDMIMTPHEVELQYERSHARGRDLIIKLMPLAANRTIDKTKGWAGLSSIEMVQLDRLHLEIKNESDTDGTVVQETTPVDVICTGPLRVDFVENVVTLEENVELRRLLPEGVTDTLKCQRLSLHLQAETGESDEKTPDDNSTAAATTARTKSGGNRFSSLPTLQVVKVVAEGNPVVLDAPSRRAHVRSRKLLYDLQLGRFQLWAAPDRPSDQVFLRYDQQEMVTRELDCLLGPEGSVKRVRASGPGRFVGMLTGSEPQPIEASWGTALLFEQEGDLHRLTMDQHAVVRVGESYGIDANVIDVWLEPAPKSLNQRAVDGGDNPIDLSLRPHRIVAVADPKRPSAAPVRLRSQGVIATTQRLEARFRHVLVPSTPAAPRTTTVTSTGTRPRSNSTVRPSPQPTPTRETRIAGRELQAWLRVTGQAVTVDNLVLRDDVRVQQFAVDQPNRPLFDLRASVVRLRDPEARQAHTATAVGNPVRIRSDQMRLQTRELNLDQARNLVWTPQPGRMQVMVDRNANGKRLATPQEMTIDWTKSMDFDGLTARFGGGVEVRSADQRMRGEVLDVQLNRKVAFGNSSSTEAIEIRIVRAEGNVLIENREFDEQRLNSISYMQVPFAQIDRQSGDLIAGGPGRVITLRDGFRGSLDLANGRSAQTPEPVDTGVKTFLQVDYQREITGNIHRRVVEFADRVQVIYGPVLSWNETLSDDAPLRSNDVLLSCDRLTVAQGNAAAQGQPTLDLLAQGNTYVEGQTFTARGERVSYEQSKELLVLQGTGRTDAVLSHQTRIGAPRSETAARKILYWTRTGRIEIDDARYLDLSNLAN